MRRFSLLVFAVIIIASGQSAKADECPSYLTPSNQACTIGNLQFTFDVAPPPGKSGTIVPFVNGDKQGFVLCCDLVYAHEADWNVGDSDGYGWGFSVSSLDGFAITGFDLGYDSAFVSSGGEGTDASVSIVADCGKFGASYFAESNAGVTNSLYNGALIDSPVQLANAPCTVDAYGLASTSSFMPPIAAAGVSDITLTFTATQVSEPSSFVLLLSGAYALPLVLRGKCPWVRKKH